MNKIKFLPLFFCFFFHLNSLNSQSSVIDSLSNKSYEQLEKLILKYLNDSLKLNQYAKAYLLKAKQESNYLKIEFGQYYKSLNESNFEEYYTLCDSLINESKLKKNIKTELEIRSCKGITYHHNNLKYKTLEEFLEVNKKLEYYKNDSLQCITNIYLGLSLSRDKQYEKALKLYNKAYDYMKSIKKESYNDSQLIIPNLIASLYYKIGKIDSAFYYINQAEKIYISINDTFFLNTIPFEKAKIQYELKDYESVIKNLKGFAPFIIKKDANYRLALNSYNLIANSYEEINDNKNAFIYYKKADSLNVIRKTNDVNLLKNYTFLIKYYRKLNNKEKQLEYINKLLEFKDLKSDEKFNINNNLYEKYEKPKLIAKKNAIITQLEKKVNKQKAYKITFVTLAFATLLLLGFQIQKKRNYKKQFLKIINEKKEQGISSIVAEKKDFIKSINIQKEIIEDILIKLETFEKKLGFLDQDLNLINLAEKFETNSNYLSKIVNHYKELSFSNYINKLRIEYIVEKLKEDSLLRKYTIKALSEEVGFKNAESFSKAFHKFTSIKPSYFIKELNKRAA